MSTSAQSSSIVRLTEQPITLKFSHGPDQAEEVESQFDGRKEYLYRASGSLLYLPEKAHKLLSRMPIYQGTDVDCSRFKKPGARSYEYSFSIHDDFDGRGRFQPPANAAPMWQGDPDDYNPGEHEQPAPPRYQPQAQPAPVRQMPARQAQAPATAQLQQAINTAATSMDVARPDAKLMLGALYCALDAFTAAQAYANEKRMPFEFTARDVTSFAITAYIGKQKGAGR